MLNKYCYFDEEGVCKCQLSDHKGDEVCLFTCEECKEYEQGDDFCEDDERVIDYLD